MDEVSIQYKFTIKDQETGTSFTDALYFSIPEYTNLSEEQLQQMKLERFNNWKNSSLNK